MTATVWPQKKEDLALFPSQIQNTALEGYPDGLLNKSTSITKEHRGPISIFIKKKHTKKLNIRNFDDDCI